MTPATGTPHLIGFVLVPRFSMVAFSSSLEPLRLANRVSGKELFAWRLYSPDGQPVAASNGVRVMVDGSYAEIEAVPEVIVCAGIDVQSFESKTLTAKLRRLAFHGSAIGAVCTGTHVLAQAGLLDGYRCTIHWENYDGFVEMFPQLDVTQELFEFDRNRFTCAGGTAAIDMMLTLIASRAGQEVAAATSDELIHHRIRDAKEHQRMQLQARLGIANPKLLAVIAAMEANLETPLSNRALVRKVGISARQLERLFSRYLGETPSRHYLGLRLQRARQLLQQTSMPVVAVALACGFTSASHFSKCYRANLGRSPSEERRGRHATRSPAQAGDAAAVAAAALTRAAGGR